MDNPLLKEVSSQGNPDAPQQLCDGFSDAVGTVGSVPEPLPADIPFHALGTPTAYWTYRDETGGVLGAVARFDPPGDKKKCLPLKFVHDSFATRWEWAGFWTDRRPLYGLERLARNTSAPVLLVEGEKTADAGQKLFSGYVVMTWGGTGTVDIVDLAPLAGREIIIWPDHDIEGQQAADKLGNRLLSELEVQSVRIVEVPDTLPAKWDLADDVPTDIDLLALLANAKDVEPPDTVIDDPDISWPDGFVMKRSGLYSTKGPVPVKLAPPFSIAAEVRDEHSNGWGLLLEWHDPDGCRHREVIPNASIVSDAANLRAILADGGLKTPSQRRGDDIVSALSSVRVARRARIVKSTGWHDNSFVLPNRIIGDRENDPLIFWGSAAGSHFCEAGTFAGWQEGIASRCVGHPLGMFVLCSAFAGPLLPKLDIEAGGFHLVGCSSVGKTTLLDVAGSVWGGGPFGFSQSWRSTSNSMEAIAAAHHNILLALDEIGETDPQHLIEAAYMLANGKGKGRMRADASLAPRHQWQAFILSTGEVTLGQRVAENFLGRDASAGQEVRMVDIEADAGTSTGVFVFPDGPDDKTAASRKLADDLKATTIRHFGHAGPKFVDAIIGAESESLETARQIIDQFVTDNVPVTAHGQVIRVARRYALVAAAGELAISFKVLPWKESDAHDAVKKIFKRWLEERGNTANREETRIVEAFRDYLQRYGDLTFVPQENQGITHDRIKGVDGWTRADEFLLTPGTFKKIAKGMNVTDAKQVLHRLGFLTRHEEAGRKVFNPSVRISGVGTRRVYEISKRILEIGDGV